MRCYRVTKYLTHLYPRDFNFDPINDAGRRGRWPAHYNYNPRNNGFKVIATPYIVAVIRCIRPLVA